MQARIIAARAAAAATSARRKADELLAEPVTLEVLKITLAKLSNLVKLDNYSNSDPYAVVFACRRGRCVVKAPRHSKAAVEALEAKRRALEALRGDHVVGLRDVLHDSVVSPLLVLDNAGVTLERLRRKDAAMDPSDLRSGCVQLLRGLAWIHEPLDEAPSLSRVKRSCTSLSFSA